MTPSSLEWEDVVGADPNRRKPLSGVFGIDAKNAWAVGSDGVDLTWNGTTWTTQRTGTNTNRNQRGIRLYKLPSKEEPVSVKEPLFLRVRRRIYQALWGLGLTVVLTGSACSLQPKSLPLATQMTVASLAVDTHLGKQSADEALQKGPLVVLFYRGHF